MNWAWIWAIVKGQYRIDWQGVSNGREVVKTDHQVRTTDMFGQTYEDRRSVLPYGI